MEIAVLGQLRVTADERDVPVTGLRRRALLTRLALEAGRTVGFHTLAESLWPEDEPVNPGQALHSLVSRLRRVLPGDLLRSEPAGYRLELTADAVDAARFERVAAQGRRMLRSGQPHAALGQLTKALGMWQGEPLEEFRMLPFATVAAARLRELWLCTVEDRIEAELAVESERVSTVAELEQLITDHPVRERLRALLIRTLDTHGRRAEALTVYENYRARLAEEFGTDPGSELRDLHLKLLRAESSPSETPPASDRRVGNLRSPLTSFVGRQTDLEHLLARLRESRLVTLVGPGGVGKTRLATETAAETGWDVWQVEVSVVTEPADVPRVVAAAVAPKVTTEIVERLSEALAVHPALLLLDGCEHLLGPVAELAEGLLGRCPELCVLVTSREPLGITGEALQPVAPLAPEAAARLFSERARAASPDVDLGDGLDRICQRLDGLPLAIELAAARLRSMPLRILAERLGDRLRPLSGGSRTALPRHRTLRGVVAWSWGLLEADERVAAESCAVFVSGFTVEAAERVGITEDKLYALVDKSLLVVEDGRFRMLDTIAEYGIERLDERGELLHARAGHAACYLELAETAAPWLRGADQLPWLARLSDERDNLLAALRFALGSSDADTAVRLAAALSMFWTLCGEHAESVLWIGRALRTPGTAPADARDRATAGYLLNAMFAGELSDIDLSVVSTAAPDGPIGAFVRALCALAAGETEAGTVVLQPWLEQPDPWTRAMMWFTRSLLHGASGGKERGERDLLEAASAFREAGERWGLSLVLMSLASIRSAENDASGSAASEVGVMLDEAVTLTRELGTHEEQQVWLMMVRIDAGDPAGARAGLLRMLDDPLSRRQQVLARLPLADLARHDGDLVEARRQLELAGEHGELAYRAMYASTVGFLAAAEGDLAAAERWLDEARVLAATIPDMPMFAQVVVGIADLRWRRADPAGAAELLGLAAAIGGGPSAGNPDVARLTRELTAYAERYAAASALDPESAFARIQGT